MSQRNESDNSGVNFGDNAHISGTVRIIQNIVTVGHTVHPIVAIFAFITIALVAIVGMVLIAFSGDSNGDTTTNTTVENTVEVSVESPPPPTLAAVAPIPPNTPLPAIIPSPTHLPRQAPTATIVPTLTPTPPPTSVPIETLLGTSIHREGIVDNPEQTTLFQFKGKKDELVELSVAPIEEMSLDPVVSLAFANSVPPLILVQDDDGGDIPRSSKIKFQLPFSGQYLIEISSSNKESQGAYQLDLLITSPAQWLAPQQ